jgi:hypothetical protein
MLLPADISTGWFISAMQSADELRLITGGRVQFVPASVTGKRKSNPKGSLLFIWRPYITPRHIITTVSLAELKRSGIWRQHEQGNHYLPVRYHWEMAEPWVEAGYRAVLVDPQHPETSIDGPVERISATILEAMPRLSQIIRSENVVIVIGFPPCTDVCLFLVPLVRVQARQRPAFPAKAALVAEQCRMVGLAAGCPWAFENPVSVFSSIFGSADYTFHPYQFTGLCADDNYTTCCLWTGNGGNQCAQGCAIDAVAPGWNAWCRRKRWSKPYRRLCE